jgi:hypothetical protein
VSHGDGPLMGGLCKIARHKAARPSRASRQPTHRKSPVAFVVLAADVGLSDMVNRRGLVRGWNAGATGAQSIPFSALDPAGADSKRWLLAEARRAPLRARYQRCRPRYLQRTYARWCSDSCRRTANGSYRPRSRRSVLDTASPGQPDAHGSSGQFFCLRPCRHRPRKSNPATAHFRSNVFTH